MCGIFGIVGKNAPVSEDVVERATKSLAHRGPDDSGTVVLRESGGLEVGLGNRRLAILDLSPLAHQPMHDRETGNWIVYNGEIYNFRDVRTELQRLGVPFVSQSDTEVALKAYGRWGRDCFARFRGMFALAIWDQRNGQLLLARDPMGIKPLYYAHAGSHLLFASEVRTLLGTGLLPRRIDPSGLVNFLTYGSAYDPLTLIDGVRALPAGHMLTWRDGNSQITPYWSLLDECCCDGLCEGDQEEEVGKLKPLLEDAVRQQLVSDVPVGIFLSGGIDSSVLVSILSGGGVRPSTFSLVFREADFSEAEHSRAIAHEFRTDHHEINVSQSDVLAAIPGALAAMDLPTMDGINTYFVSRETRAAGVKVALSGLGGDEVFAGYSSFRTVPRAERIGHFWKRVPVRIRASFASAFASVAPESDQNRKLALLARANGRALHPYFVTRMLFTPDQRDLLFARPEEIGIETATASQCQDLRLSRSLDPVNRVSYLEMRCYMLNTLLRDADFMSMSQGLEVRVPLVDHQLAKTILALPGAWKVDGTPKKLLVESLAGPLPETIVHRPKRGFTLPFEHWLRQDLRSEMESVLCEKHVAAGALGSLLDPRQVEQVWRDFLRGTVSWTRPWSLYVLQRWCEMHLQSVN